MAYDYGNLFNNSFDSGFSQGRTMRDRYNKKKAAEEIKGIRTTRLTEAAPTAEQSAAADAYNEDLAAQDNATFGTEATADDYQYGAQHTQQETAVPMSEQYAQRAEIYGKHGLTDKSEAYTDKADVVGRQEKSDANAEVERGLRVKGLERTERKAGASETFGTGLSSYMAKVKSGAEVFNLAKVYEMGAAADVDMAEINQNVKDHFNVDDATAEAAAKEKLSKLAEAAAQGMDALLAAADSDLTDNISPSLRTNKDGSATVMYGDKELYVLPKDSAELPQTSSLYMQIRGNIMKDPTMAGIQFMAADKFRQDREKNTAQIGLIGAQTREADAKAYASRAKGALTGRTDPNARGEGRNQGVKLAVERLDKDLDRLNVQYTAAVNNGDKVAQKNIAAAMANKEAERNRYMLPQSDMSDSAQEVVVEGKVIGTASTQAEADALVANFRKGGGATQPAPAAPAAQGLSPKAAPPKPDSIELQDQRSRTQSAISQLASVKVDNARKIAAATSRGDTKAVSALTQELQTLTKQERALKEQLSKLQRGRATAY